MDFVEALWKKAAGGVIPVIPDIKRISPKEGDLLRGRDPVEVALALAKAGAPVLSVVTEEKSFGGSLKEFARIAEATGLPVLRKDFIRTPEQIRESVRAGAGAVLLIASIVDRETLELLYREALAQHVVPLLETHTAEEIEWINALEPRLAGINNRDILALERDGGTVDTTASLIGRVKPGPFLVSESGIHTREDVRRAGESGAHGVLVGTALLKAPDIGEAYARMAVTSPNGTGEGRH